jgi:hypothetical protein
VKERGDVCQVCGRERRKRRTLFDALPGPSAPVCAWGVRMTYLRVILQACAEKFICTYKCVIAC